MPYVFAKYCKVRFKSDLENIESYRKIIQKYGIYVIDKARLKSLL